MADNAIEGIAGTEPLRIKLSANGHGERRAKWWAPLMLHASKGATMNGEIYRFEVGSFEGIAVSDGTFAYPDYSFFINAPLIYNVSE